MDRARDLVGRLARIALSKMKVYGRKGRDTLSEAFGAMMVASPKGALTTTTGNARPRPSPPKPTRTTYNIQPARLSPSIAAHLEPLLQLADVHPTVERFQQWLAPRAEDFKVELIAIGSFAVILKFNSTEHKGETTVMKAIPLMGPTASDNDGRSSVPDAMREVELLAKMSAVDGFVAFRGAKVVKGAWPVTLENLRKVYASTHGDAALPFASDLETTSQCWLILEMEDAGAALDTIKTFTVKQVRSMFWQLAKALRHAEHFVNFEHRDLHLGNVCVKPTKGWTRQQSLNKAGADKKEVKYKLTIIDYSLSRATIEPGRIVYRILEDEIFSGQGNLQYDVYRSMRDYNTLNARHASTKVNEIPEAQQTQWAAYTPGTNVIWLTYILGDLLSNSNIVVKDMEGNTKKMYEELRSFYRRLTNNGGSERKPEYGSVSKFLEEIMGKVAAEDGEA